MEVGAGEAATAAANRWMWSVTEVPAAPRTLSRAWSGVRPSREVPSTVVMTSPALRPAASVGEPSIGATITMWQVGPNVAQSLVLPASSTAPISAPIPSNWPEMSLSVPT